MMALNVTGCRNRYRYSKERQHKAGTGRPPPQSCAYIWAHITPTRRNSCVQQREEPAPEVVAHRVLTALPMVVSVLGVAEAQAGLVMGAWAGFGVDSVPREFVCGLCLE
jgi:hypothetical protein